MPTDPFSRFFDDPASWLVVASGQAEGKLTRVAGPGDKAALQLDYHFHGGGGFVVMRKELSFALPEMFEIEWQQHGISPSNHFEFKVTDPGGANAWRYLQENFEFPEEWTPHKITERDLPFAWGPAGGGAPSHVSAVELVIAAGPGGMGSVCFSDISLADQTLHQTPKVSVSSHQLGESNDGYHAANTWSRWRADTTDSAPWWCVDFERSIRFGGLVITWPASSLPRNFWVEISTDGDEWAVIYRASHALGRRSYISAPKAEARYLRVHFASAAAAEMLSLDLRPDAFSHTPNEFIHAVAADFPRGWFPRYWSREQSYWTPIGSPEGTKRGLINEEGMVEVDEAGFSLEPFLLIGGELVTWADAEIAVSLCDHGAPFPVVTWQVGELKLQVMPWMDGAGDELTLRIDYQLENGQRDDVRLAIAVRPFQVNPPWQAFRNLGGQSPIQRIHCSTEEIIVDGRRVTFDLPPQDQGAAAFEEGGVMEYLSRGKLPPHQAVDDASGLASAAMIWEVASAADFKVTLSFPYYQTANRLSAASHQNAVARWREIFAPVEWQVPSVARSAIECFRTATAHILINRDSPAIQPGPRRYTRSWIRDCVIMGAALVKAGQPHALRDFMNWYVQFLHEDGHVPCVVDRDGVDSLVEHDSHGQWIWGVREVFRADQNRDFLKPMWPSVERAAEYLHHLRSQRMTREYDQPLRTACYGLLPESASHEGYLAHPVHSYWDDFWGIRGLEAAADLAETLGLQDEAKRWQDESTEFLRDTLDSIDHVISAHQLNYIPGSVEWADFDPTATANAIAQLDFADDLPAAPLHQMLETYLADFHKKHHGGAPWLNYTAYEIRIIGAFVRIGKRDEAHQLLDFFLSDRRPLAWNQWPEISWRDPRSPGHLGDVPHTWIAAEYMLALAAIVASERESTKQMILASGLPWSWISEENGFLVRGLVTHYGPLDFQILADDRQHIRFQISDRITLPSGGLKVAPPLPPGMKIVSALAADGQPLIIDAAGLSVDVPSLPMSARLFLDEKISKTLV